jgi:hypothetical protein
MPITEMPDPSRHRICRRCQQWFEPHEGSVLAPEMTGPLGAMQAIRSVSGDPSVMRFQCHRCTKIRKATQIALWSTLAVVLAIVLLLERIGILH